MMSVQKYPIEMTVTQKNTNEWISKLNYDQLLEEASKIMNINWSLKKQLKDTQRFIKDAICEQKQKKIEAIINEQYSSNVIEDFTGYVEQLKILQKTYNIKKVLLDTYLTEIKMRKKGKSLEN